MHYTSDLSESELAKTHPKSKASAASGPAFGMLQSEKIQKIYRDIIRENEKSALDCVLVLGDLSVDDYDFRNLPENYCEKFKNECLDRLPCKYYAIPGNHDSYPDDAWRSIFGTDREFSVSIGNCAFIMADSFKGIPATNASGAPLNPISTDFVETELKRYNGKHIFLCSHYIKDDMLDNKCKQLLSKSSDLKLMFRGHTHIASNLTIELEEQKIPLIDIGGYGYSGKLLDGKWVFDIFDYSWAWGYQILEIYDDRIKTYHVKTDEHYKARNGEFNASFEIQNHFEILL